VIAPESNASNLRNLNRVINTLSNLKNMGYLADLEVHGGTAPDLAPRVTRAILRRHLDSVRAGEVPIDTPLEIGNVTLRLRDGNHPEVFVSSTIYPVEAQFLQHVHGRLDEKVHRFRNLGRQDIPFVVALSGGDDLHQNFHHAAEAAVLGWRTPDPSYLLPAGPPLLSGVLSCTRYIQADHIELDLEFIHNPGAAAPLSVDCLQDVRHLFPKQVDAGVWTGTTEGPSNGIVVLSHP
jgi:hypothetical protein